MSSMPRILILLLLATMIGCDSAPLAEPEVGAPRLSFPLSGAAEADALQLTWDPVDGASAYRVQVATGQSFAVVVMDSSRVVPPHLVIRGLEMGTTYSWRVASQSDSGEWAWSEARSFRVARHLDPPDRPTLLAPFDGAVNLPIETAVEWQPTPQATTYQLQVALESRLILMEVDLENIEETRFAIRGLVLSYPYWWRVRAWNPAGYGPWSRTWTFQIEF